MEKIRNIKRPKLTIAVTAALALAAGGVGVAIGTGEENDRPITGSALDKASEAALNHTGEGNVTETEAGDEESYYEVEVSLDDGSEIDVQLDRGFNVVGEETDTGNEDEGEHEGQN